MTSIRYTLMKPICVYESSQKKSEGEKTYPDEYPGLRYRAALAWAQGKAQHHAGEQRGEGENVRMIRLGWL